MATTSATAARAATVSVRDGRWFIARRGQRSHDRTSGRGRIAIRHRTKTASDGRYSRRALQWVLDHGKKDHEPKQFGADAGRDDWSVENLGPRAPEELC